MALQWIGENGRCQPCQVSIPQSELMALQCNLEDGQAEISSGFNPSIGINGFAMAVTSPNTVPIG